MLFAARAQHWQQKLLPALQDGAWVLCDRFVDASYAYQVGGRGLPQGMVDTLSDLVLAGHQPGLTLLLDVDPQIGMARAGARGGLDRFEQEQFAFFERVRAHYLARAQAEPVRIQVVDAGQPLLDVEQQVRACIERYIARLSSGVAAT